MDRRGHGGVNLRPSNDAGRYVCDGLCYALGGGIDQGTIGTGVFVHIPPNLGNNGGDGELDDILVDVLIRYINQQFPQR